MNSAASRPGTGLVAALCALGIAGLAVIAWPARRPSLPPAPTASTGAELRPAVLQPAANSPLPSPAGTPIAGDPGARIRAAAAGGAPWSALQELLDELALGHPALALELAEQMGPTDRERYIAMAEIVQRWARREPRAALDWSIAQGRRWDAMNASFPYLVLNRVAQTEPEAVIALAQDTLLRWTDRPGAEPGELAYTAINALLGASDLAFARAAIERWDKASLQARVGRDALERVAWLMSDAGSPPDTIAWLQTLAPSGPRTETLGAIAARWAENDPVAAVAWASAADLSLRTEALPRVLAAWGEKDLLSAAAWLTERDTDPTTDPAWAHFASQAQATREDPGIALKFAALIQDPGLRATTTDSVLAAWHDRDPVAATRYIHASSAFTPAEKQRLLTALNAP